MNDSFQNILNCFSGADGGISFIKFKLFIEDMEKNYINGNNSAGEILKIVDQLSRMIDIANEKVEINKPKNKKFNENEYLD